MFGYSTINSVPTAIALSSSESFADIHNGTNNGFEGSACEGLSDPRLQNCGVDNAGIAVRQALPFVSLTFQPGAAVDASQVINSSFPPVFLNCDDIDFQGTRGISNTFFVNFSHAWEKDTRTTFLGLGGSAEFGKAKSCCSTSDCQEECGSCFNSALSQWSVWLKGGVTFN